MRKIKYICESHDNKYPFLEMMSDRYSNFIERGRTGLVQLLSNSRLQDLISRYPVTDETRSRIRATDFIDDSAFYYKHFSIVVREPARFLAKAVVDFDDETIKWFLLLYSVSSVRERLYSRFYSHFDERTLSYFGICRFDHYGRFDLNERRESGIASLVDGIIDVRGIVSRYIPQSFDGYYVGIQELSLAIPLFALNAGYKYIEDLELFPGQLLLRSADMPFIVASSEYTALMTGENFDVVFQRILQDNGALGFLDDISLIEKKDDTLKKLEREKSMLEGELAHKKECIRQQETEIDIIADLQGKGISENDVQARISKCNDKEHRAILYKFESITGKKLSFLDDISETGLPIPFVDLIKNEYHVIISEKEIQEIKTIENLADCIITHKRFMEHFVPAVQQGKEIEPLRDDDPYDLETRIEETEMFYHSKVDKEQIHSIDDLRLYVTGNDLLMQKIVSALVEQLGVEPEEVTMESSFSNDLGADSLDSIELLMNAEREYGIKIPDEETSSIATVRDLYNVIVEKMQNLPNA